MRLLAAILATTLLAACATNAEQRTVSEQLLEALRAKITAHWNPPPSISSQPDQYRLTVLFHLNRDGRLSAPSSRGSGPLYQSAVEAAKQAIELSQPFDTLSPFPYELWKTVEINFDPGTMHR